MAVDAADFDSRAARNCSPVCRSARAKRQLGVEICISDSYPRHCGVLDMGRRMVWEPHHLARTKIRAAAWTPGENRLNQSPGKLPFTRPFTFLYNHHFCPFQGPSQTADC